MKLVFIMSKLTIKELEGFLQSSDLESFLGQMPPKGENVSYLRLVNLINDPATSFKDLKSQVQLFTANKNFCYELKEKLRLIVSFKEIEQSESNPEERNVLIKELLKGYLGLKFNYKKPKQVEAVNIGLENNEEEEQKQKDETEFFCKHLRIIKELESTFTLKNLDKVESDWFFRNVDLGAIKLEDLEKKLLKTLVKKILKGSPLNYLNYKQFLINLCSLDSKKIDKFNEDFLSSIMLLPLDWLEELLTLENCNSNESFIMGYIVKRFEVLELLPVDISLENLEDIYEFAKTLKPKFNTMKKECQFQLLIKKLDNRTLKKQELKDYLENPIYEKTMSDHVRFSLKNQSEKKMVEANSLKVKKMADIFPHEWRAKHSETIDKALTFFFEGDASFEEWVPYFNEQFVKKLCFTVKLLKGELPENFDEVLNETEIKDLTEKKNLTILDKNQKRFCSGENVELELELKNVEELQVKIFQINIENALLENPKVNFVKMDLLGLVAKEVLNYKFEKPPLKQWKQTLRFESIELVERGVFVIDFIAGRLSSRAIIHKGSLSLIYAKKKLGTVCWILDEQSQVCKGKNTGLYMGKKFFPVDKKGELHIPSNVADKKSQVVVCHNNFAVLSNVEVADPNFTMSMKMVTSTEQLRPGNIVDFLILPELFIFNDKLDLNQLIRPKLQITIKAEGGSTKVVNIDGSDLSMVNGRFFKCSFAFLPKTTKINFELKGNILLHGKDERQVSASSNIDFLPSHKRPLEQVYLSKQGPQQFEVQVRGRNGERRRHAEFTIQVNSEPLKDKSRCCTFVVGENGGKTLTQMELINKFSLNQGNEEIKCYAQDVQSEYSSDVMITTQDSLLIPVLQPSKVKLFRKLQNEKTLLPGVGQPQIYLQDLTNESSVLVREKGSSFITIQNLNQGSYRLMILQKDNVNYTSVSIRVLEGKRLNLDKMNFIEWNNEYIRTPNNTIFCLLTSSNESAEKSLKKEHSGRLLTGKILFNTRNSNKFKEDSAPESKQFSEAVLVCSNFLNHENQILTKNNHKGRHHTNYDHSFVKSFKENYYFSNKMLGEELIYVLQRRNQSEFMGNTLDKPSMLLKREKNISTTQDVRNMDQGGGGGGGSRAATFLKGRSLNKGHFVETYQRRRLNLSYDFLKTPGKIITGIQINEDGTFNVPTEVLEKFNYVRLIVNVGGGVFLNKTLKEEWKEPEMQDLGLDQSKKTGYVYRNIRLVNKLAKEKSYCIENVENTEHWSVGSVKELMNSQKVLARHFAPKLKEWEFLVRWNKMKPAEKLKTFDKFYSHELNVFVYFKDREFFDEVVSPFIQNKRDKSFVDFFLLGDKQEAVKYLKVARLENLNISWKVLLFILCWDHDDACSIIELLHSQTSLLRNKQVELDFPVLFDNLLNSRKEKNKSDDKPEANVRAGITQRVMAPRQQMMMVNHTPLQNFSNQRDRAYSVTKEMNFEEEDFESSDEYDAYDDEDEEEDDYYGESDDSENRRNIKFREMGAKVYQGTEATSEYVEKGFYYFNESPNFSENIFYFNLVEHVLRNGGSLKGFLDKNYIYCTHSMTELIFVLSVMDLSFDQIKLDQKLSKNRMTLTAPENCLLFSKEISEVKGKSMDLDILVSQRFYDPTERYYHLEDGTKVEKPLKEFVKGKVYGCRVVVTNSTVSDQKVSIITEIPQGSIPLMPEDSLKVSKLQISSFRSEIIDLTFYFPETGEFTVYPATVAKEDNIVASAKEGMTVLVKSKKEQIVLESISDVLSTGNMSDILNFLRAKNLRNSSVFQFQSIGWLMRNKDFYSQVIQIFREKGFFSQQIWQFSVYHGDVVALKEYLKHSKVKKSFSMFFYLKNQYLEIDNVTARDYFPLINPRAHSTGDNQANIMNKQFHKTYKDFLLYLLEKGQPSLEDRVLWITYMLLQDRVHEASEMFRSISKTDRESVTTRIQYDYIEAYIDFMTGFPQFTIAKTLCEEYLDYPVLSWRNLFVEIANQLSEYQEIEIEKDHLTEEKKSLKKKADLSPYLLSEISESTVKVSFRNQSSFQMEFYKVDIEVLFTQDPFETRLNSSLTNVLPFLKTNHKVEKKSEFQMKEFSIPKALETENLLIRVIDKSKQSTLLKYIPFHLEAVLNEEYGIVKLIESSLNKPIPKIYVKCFAKMKNGKIRFFKDGYTDLRGSFDYASMNTSGGSQTSLFRLLITSPGAGAKILEAKPPVGTVRVEGKAKKIMSKKYRGIKAKMGKKQMKYRLSDYEEE